MNAIFDPILSSVPLAVGATTIFVNLLLGVVVFINNPKSATSRFFGLLVLTFVFWEAGNLLGTIRPSLPEKLIWIRLVMFFAVWQVYFLYLFITVFPKHDFANVKFHKIFSIF